MKNLAIICKFYEEYEKIRSEKLRKDEKKEIKLIKLFFFFIYIVSFLSVLFLAVLIEPSIFPIWVGLCLFFIILYIYGIFYSKNNHKISTQKWIIKQLRNVSIIREILLSKNPVFNWEAIKFIQIKKNVEDWQNRISNNDEKLPIYYKHVLILHFHEDELPLNLEFNYRKEKMELIKDFFNYMRLINSKCPNCNTPIRLFNYNFCKYCHYKFT